MTRFAWILAVLAAIWASLAALGLLRTTDAVPAKPWSTAHRHFAGLALKKGPTPCTATGRLASTMGGTTEPAPDSDDGLGTVPRKQEIVGQGGLTVRLGLTMTGGPAQSHAMPMDRPPKA